MSQFKDTNGRSWTVALDAPTIRAVRAQLDGLDLAAVDGSAYERLAGDPCLLVDALYVVCREQAQAAGVDDVGFGRALVGDVIEHAAAALLEAILDFFPQRRRSLCKALAAKSGEIRDLAMERALSKVQDPGLREKVVQAMEDRMDAEIAKTLQALGPQTPSNSATSSPALLESFPDD